MKNILFFLLAAFSANAFCAPATERYVDAAAAAAQTNAQNYATSIVGLATDALEAKIVGATNGIPQAIQAAASSASTASATASAASSKADSAIAAAASASNIAATASASVATEKTAREAADATHTAAISAETAARTAADANLQQQITEAVHSVSNAATMADIQAEAATRQAQAAGLHDEIVSTAAGLQPKLTAGANITISGNVISASVSGGGGGSGIGTNEVVDIIHTHSLGGIWDDQLQVWWTPKMINGSMKYCATTNVNVGVAQ